MVEKGEIITKLEMLECRNQCYTSLLSAQNIKKLKIGAWQKFCVGLFLQIQAILWGNFFVDFTET